MYFYLNKEPISDEHKKLRAGRKQFKNFCTLNADDKKTFFEIHCHAFRFLYILWCRESDKESD